MLLTPQPQTINELIFNTLHHYKIIISQVLLLAFLIALLQAIPILSGLNDSSFLLLNYLLLLPELYIEAMLLVKINNLLHGVEKNLKETFFIVGHRYLPYLVLLIFLGFVIGIGLLLFILPALVAILFLLFAISYFWFDQLSVFASIKESFNLVKANLWRSMFAFLLLGFIFIVLAGFGILSSLVGIKNVFAIAFIDIVSYIFISPLLSLFWIEIFYDLKVRKNLSIKTN